MQAMTIRVTNSAFEGVSTDEFETVDLAYRAGIKAALAIAAGEVLAGHESSIVQIAINVSDEPVLMRGVVSVSTARLLIT